MKYFSVEESPVFRKRLQVLPGLTSIATIYIPKDSSPYRKFYYERVQQEKAV